jgi:membrane associated rhomboid family serine protease
MLSALFGIASVVSGVFFVLSTARSLLVVLQSAYGPPLVSGVVVFGIATGGLFGVFDANVNVFGHFTGFLLGSLFSAGMRITDRYDDLV